MGVKGFWGVQEGGTRDLSAQTWCKLLVLFLLFCFCFFFVESGGELVGVVALCGGAGVVGGDRVVRTKIRWGVYPQEGTKGGTFSARLRRV